MLAGFCFFCSCQKDDNAIVGWEKVASSLMDNKSILSLAVSDNSMLAVASSYSKGNLYKSADNGTSWTPVAQIPYTVTSVAVLGNYIFAGTSKGIYRSADNGVSWTAVNSGLPLLGGNLQESSPFVCNNRLFIKYNGNIYYTTDNGDRWTSATVNLNTTPVDAFTISRTFIIAATWNGVYHTTDNGINWSTAITNNKNIKNFALSSENIVAGASNGFYYSSDNGKNWSKAKVSDDFQSPWVECFVNSGKNIYAGTQVNGMYYSSDNGLSWMKFNNGFEIIKRNISIKSLIINGSYIYAGSNGDGIWRRKI
jgi:photosystem II stability/assembly factor-like uncharacterized protein